MTWGLTSGLVRARVLHDNRYVDIYVTMMCLCVFCLDMYVLVVPLFSNKQHVLVCTKKEMLVSKLFF